METITFTCKTVTPLVMNGPYGDFPELRPPGIKASLRFWWRALHGHFPLEDRKDGNGKVVEKGLRTREGEIFGNTKGRSKVLIRVIESIAESQKSKTSLLPHKGGSEAAGYIVGEYFTIRLDYDEKVISKEELKNLFILACTLGGWGKRSRRGFGSVMVTELEINGTTSTLKVPESIEDIYALLPKEYFEKANRTIFSNFKRNEKYPYLKSIEVGVEFDSERKLLEKIGSSSSESKRDNNDDLEYRNSLGHVSKRFASPFYVSIIKVQDNFFPVYVTLNIALEQNKAVPQNASEIQREFKNRIKP